MAVFRLFVFLFQTMSVTKSGSCGTPTSFDLGCSWKHFSVFDACFVVSIMLVSQGFGRHAVIPSLRAICRHLPHRCLTLETHPLSTHLEQPTQETQNNIQQRPELLFHPSAFICAVNLLILDISVVFPVLRENSRLKNESWRFG